MLKIDVYRTTKLSTASTHADYLRAELFSFLKHLSISLIVDRPLGPIGLGETIVKRAFRKVSVGALKAVDAGMLGASDIHSIVGGTR